MHPTYGKAISGGARLGEAAAPSPHAPPPAMDCYVDAAAADSDANLLKATFLLVAVIVHAPLLMGLSSRRRRSSHPVLRFFLWGLSTVYLPLMSAVISFLTCYLPSLKSPDDDYWFLFLVIMVVLIQFVRANADMAALAVAAVTSPVVSGDDNSLKIRPSVESLLYSIWVAGLVIYNVFSYEAEAKAKAKAEGNDHDSDDFIKFFIPIIGPLWALGACRMVLRFTAFHRATRSFALGRNVQLISGYMATLQQETGEQVPVPRLIVTGEKNQDVKKTPAGYRMKPSTPSTSLVTLDRIWSEDDSLLRPELKDLCLSFALFKCLRRRLAGCRLAEAGSSWAFHFVRDGLLGREDDHERIFRVIAGELAFARDFYYSPLPVASLGTLAAALHFFFSLIISVWFCLLSLLLLVAIIALPIAALAFVLSVVIASTEISDMVASVRSNWTKISIISHYIRLPDKEGCLGRIFSCLLRCKAPKHQIKDKIGQVELLNPGHFCKLSWVCHHKAVPLDVKDAILDSFKSCGGQLRGCTAIVRNWRQAYSHDLTWACLGSGEVTTTTDVLLVWHIATSLFEMRCSASSPTRMVVAQTLSRYCAYLVAEAPDLLPDDSAWTKLRYKEVKKEINKVSKSVPQSGVYGHLIDSFSASSCHDEVLNKGARLGKQLVEEAQSRRSIEGGEAGAGAECGDEVWKLLAEFWSEMVLCLAPSDNHKPHIEALQRGGELITLLWALLLHAGITSRPDDFNPIACVRVSMGDAVSNIH